MREKHLIYVLRTTGVSGNVSDVLDFICREFTVSKQTAKKMIEPGSLLVCFGSEEREAIEYTAYLARDGLYAEHGLEDSENFFGPSDE